MSDRRGLGKGIGSIIIYFMMKEYHMIKEISVIGAGGKMGSWFAISLMIVLGTQI